MPTCRSFPKPRARFRHRYGAGDVIDHAALCDAPAQPRPLDRAARRAARAALAGYGQCGAVTAAPRLPTVSRGA